MNELRDFCFNWTLKGKMSHLKEEDNLIKMGM